MGYTHYYYKNELVHDTEKWNKFLADVQKIASKFQLCGSNSLDFIKDDVNVKGTGEIKIAIGDGMGDGTAATFNADEICFNGVGPESHETLTINRDDSNILTPSKQMGSYYKDNWEKDKRHFNFTKTAHKPYDLLVTAVLVLYKNHFGDTTSISGDGGVEGFDSARELIKKELELEFDTDTLFPPNQED